MNKELTYRRLGEKLKDLGYVEKSIEYEGNHHRVYKHKHLDAATIFLPEMPLDAAVVPMHVNRVRTILKYHGLIEDNGLPF